MLFNFLKTALRNIKREKTYSVINIFGLSIGLTCFVLFYFSWQYEHSFDRFHKNAENIYQLFGKKISNGKTINSQFFNKNAASVIASEVPEVKAAAAVEFDFENGATIKIGNQQFRGSVCFANDDIFKIFSIPIIIAQSTNCLQNPQAILLSESVAKKYFGSENPMGKPVIIRSTEWEGDERFLVAGITKDLPNTSTYKTDIICSSKKFNEMITQIFVLLHKDASVKNAEYKIKEIMKSKFSDDPYTKRDSDNYKIKQLIGLHIENQAITKYLSIFGIVAFVVLMLSCINYINLSISMSIKRIKEIGVRKTLGSGKINLMWQFLSESFVMNIISLILAFIFIYVLISIIRVNIMRFIKISEIGSMELITGLIAIIIFVSFISGAYPAIYVSRLNPTAILSGSRIKKQKGISFRKCLILFQFSALMILLILTTGISNQLGYIENKGLGFSKENIVLLEGLDIQLLMDRRTEEFRAKMLENPHIKSVAYLSGHPAGFPIERQVSIQGVESSIRWSDVLVGKGFLNTFSIPLIEGRDFVDTDKLKDIPRKVLINEEAAKLLGNGSAIGKTCDILSSVGSKKAPVEVIGVFKNFTQRTLHYQIKPMIISQLPGFAHVTAVKIDRQDVQGAINHIKTTWNSFFPNVQVTYTFFDEKIQSLYLSEYRLGSMAKIFTLLAVIIAVMGIFGLTAFSTEQRKKEIAIRKVLGAAFNKLVITFFKEINLPAVIANIVSLPIGIYLINKWLEEFAYKTSIPITQYILVIIASLALAFITVGVQVFRVARANPINSLRSE